MKNFFYASLAAATLSLTVTSQTTAQLPPTERTYTLEDFNSVIGYQIHTAPAHGKGYTEEGDVIHLKRVDRTFVAVYVERNRKIVAEGLGRFHETENGLDNYISVPLPDDHYLFMDWDEQFGGFHLAESIGVASKETAENGGGTDQGMP